MSGRSTYLLDTPRVMTMVDRILKIKPGDVEVFVYDNQKHIRSGVNIVYYVKRFCSNRIPSDIKDYKTEIQGNVLLVTAVKK